MSSSEGLKPEGNRDSSIASGYPKKTSSRADLPQLLVPNDSSKTKTEHSIKSSAPDNCQNQSFKSTQKINPIQQKESFHDPANEKADVEGGEWELLKSKISKWWISYSASENSLKTLQIIFLLLALAILLTTFQVFGRVLGAIEQIPLAPQLLQVSGFFWLMTFSAKKLLKTTDRQKALEGIRNKLQSFRKSKN